MQLSTNINTLFANSEITYNGYSIPKIGMKIKASVKPVYSKGGYNRIYDEVTLIVDFIETAGGSSHNSNTDETIQTIRRKLMAPRKDLKIKGLGFANATITQSSASASKDWTLGPKPVDFQWEPMNGNTVAHIVWIVSYTIAGCTNALAPDGLTYLDYSVGINWSDTTGGLTTRTISGEAGFRPVTNPSAISNTVNQQYLGLILTKLFPRLGGYDRTVDVQLSENRISATFTITDTEKTCQVPLPIPMLDLQMVHNLKGSLNNGAFNVWDFTISADVTVYFSNNTGVPFYDLKRKAWIALGRIVTDRLLHYKSIYYTDNGETVSAKLHVLSIDVTDYPTSNAFSLSLSGIVYVPAHLIFQATGFFKSITGVNTTWNDRDYYIENTLSGNAEFNLTRASVTQAHPLVNICSVTGAPVTEKDSIIYPPSPSVASELLVRGDRPKPSESYVNYWDDATLTDINETVPNIPLSDQEPRSEEKRKDGTEDTRPISDTTEILPATTSEKQAAEVIFHNYTGKVYGVKFVGHAVRIGYRVNAPNLVSYGGMKAIKVGNSKVRTKITRNAQDGNNNDTALYSIAWEKYYILEPTTIAGSQKLVTAPLHDRYITDAPKDFQK